MLLAHPSQTGFSRRSLVISSPKRPDSASRRDDKLPDKAPGASPGMWGVLWPLPNCSCSLVACQSWAMFSMGHAASVRWDHS